MSPPARGLLAQGRVWGPSYQSEAVPSMLFTFQGWPDAAGVDRRGRGARNVPPLLYTYLF